MLLLEQKNVFKNKKVKHRFLEIKKNEWIFLTKKDKKIKKINTLAAVWYVIYQVSGGCYCCYCCPIGHV